MSQGSLKSYLSLETLGFIFPQESDDRYGEQDISDIEDGKPGKCMDEVPNAAERNPFKKIRESADKQRYPPKHVSPPSEEKEPAENEERRRRIHSYEYLGRQRYPPRSVSIANGILIYPGYPKNQKRRQNSKRKPHCSDHRIHRESA
jgi:hypothetical protein